MKPTAALYVSLALLTLGVRPVAAQTPRLGHPLVFVKYIIPDDPGDPIRGNLFRLDPDGAVVNLTNRSDVAVRDPEVSWDATRVVFSMLVGPDTGSWQIYEIGVDGSGLRKISRDPRYNDLDPAYLPDGRIVFTTDRLRWSDGYENVPATQLAVMNHRGRRVEVLKVNPAGHLNPLPGSDGLIYFTQWDFHDRRVDLGEGEDGEEELDVNRFLLWKIFADGSGLDHPAFGAHTIEDFTPGYVEVRERPNAAGTFVATFGSQDTQELTSFHPDRLVFVPGTFLTFEGASLVLMRPRDNQNRDRVVYLTPASGEEDEDGDDDEEGEDENERGKEAEEGDGFWRSPFPLADGRLVASFSPGESDSREDMPLPFQLWTMNGDGSAKTLLYEEPGRWCLQAVEVVSRKPPVLRSGVTDPRYPYAIINSLDVTLREKDGQPGPSDGEITEVRVYREDVRTPNTHDLQLDERQVRTGVFDAWDDPDTRAIGTAPVHADNSFAVVVPADTPLTWELLDAKGNVVVRERFGTELRAGEVRRCAGCHSPHNGRTGADTNFALEAPTNLSGKKVDRDGNGVVDLLEGLCQREPDLCSRTGLRLRGKARASGVVALRWRSEPSVRGTVEIFRRALDGGDFAPIGTVEGTARSYRDHGLVPGVSYLYKVRTMDAAGHSQWSNRVRVTARQ